jgi:hypothetical protein
MRPLGPPPPTLDEYLRKEIEDRKREIARGFYTAKAREIDNGSIEKCLDLLLEVQEEIERTRPDFGASEKDLWANNESVPEGSAPLLLPV